MGQGGETPSEGQGRALADRSKLTQSLDANLGTGHNNTSFAFQEDQPRRASIGEGSIATAPKVFFSALSA